MTESIAKLVVKDLVSYDGVLAESKLTQQRLLTLTDKVTTLELVINNLREQVEVKDSIILKKDNQLSEYQNMSTDLEQEVKRLNRIGKLYKIGSAIGVAAILLNTLSPK